MLDGYFWNQVMKRQNIFTTRPNLKVGFFLESQEKFVQVICFSRFKCKYTIFENCNLVFHNAIWDCHSRGKFYSIQRLILHSSKTLVQLFQICIIVSVRTHLDIPEAHRLSFEVPFDIMIPI